ncbi:MAG: hypothetical protein ACREPD_10530 [Stenotrophomonas sp.]|uniref:hypothetical protein n=1 Tax=Stenotrophomonas sp. TaxID=69392 RepID=UPI003D6D6E7E
MKHPYLLPSFLLLLASGPCWAVEPLDTFSVRVGGYITDFDTRVRADGQTGEGTRIDLNRDLGLDNNNAIGVVALSWRPWEKHEFGLSWYRDSADAERNTDRDIDFNGEHYATHTRIRAKFDLDAYEGYYTWWAWGDERWALGPRVGLIWYQMDLDLSATADVNGNPLTARAGNNVNADLPAPTIGGSWRWAPSDHWRLSADAGYFSASLNDVDADVTFGRGGVEYFPWENWGFSLDYTVRRIEADVDASRLDGNLRFIDSGVRVGVIYRF